MANGIEICVIIVHAHKPKNFMWVGRKLAWFLASVLIIHIAILVTRRNVIICLPGFVRFWCAPLQRLHHELKIKRVCKDVWRIPMPSENNPIVDPLVLNENKCPIMLKVL